MTSAEVEFASRRTLEAAAAALAAGTGPVAVDAERAGGRHDRDGGQEGGEDEDGEHGRNATSIGKEPRVAGMTMCV